MDIDALKGKTIDDATHAALAEFVSGLQSKAETAEGKARTATRESIDGRKTLKAERDAAFERLGITSADELEALPAGKGQAEALRQLETKLARAARDVAEKDTALQALQGQVLSAKKSQAIAAAVAKHGFADAEVAATLLASKVKQEGDEFLFDAGDGKLVSVDDGAAFFAKTKPFLVKPAGGGGGSGFQGTAGSGNTANPWDPKHFNVTEQIKVRREDPARADSLKAAASATA